MNLYESDFFLDYNSHAFGAEIRSDDNEMEEVFNEMVSNVTIHYLGDCPDLEGHCVVVKYFDPPVSMVRICNQVSFCCRKRKDILPASQ